SRTASCTPAAKWGTGKGGCSTLVGWLETPPHRSSPVARLRLLGPARPSGFAAPRGPAAVGRDRSRAPAACRRVRFRRQLRVPPDRRHSVVDDTVHPPADLICSAP